MPSAAMSWIKFVVGQLSRRWRWRRHEARNYGDSLFAMFINQSWVNVSEVESINSHLVGRVPSALRCPIGTIWSSFQATP
jgi:hypothetical protein